jgi:hypothetical protein
MRALVFGAAILISTLSTKEPELRYLRLYGCR